MSRGEILKCRRDHGGIGPDPRNVVAQRRQDSAGNIRAIIDQPVQRRVFRQLSLQRLEIGSPQPRRCAMRGDQGDLSHLEQGRVEGRHCIRMTVEYDNGLSQGESWIIIHLTRPTVPVVHPLPQWRRGLNRSRLGYSSLPIATAVSAMRLEKPHSLSYQAMMRTSVSPITFVSFSAKIEECGSWLKSPDTSGSS